MVERLKVPIICKLRIEIFVAEIERTRIYSIHSTGTSACLLKEASTIIAEGGGLINIQNYTEEEIMGF